MKSFVCCLVSLAMSAALARNLIRDDFIPDNCGGFVGWDATVRGHIRAQVRLLSEASPNGMRAVRVTSEKVYDNTGFEGTYFKTTFPIKLNPDAEYRFSAFVRTKGLTNQSQRVMLFHPSFWLHGPGEIELPADTQGQWTNLQWRGKLDLRGLGEEARVGFYLSGALERDAYVDLAEPTLDGPGPDSLWALRPAPRRITPFEPLLDDLAAEDARMVFYYPGELVEDGEALNLRVTAGEKTVTASFGADHKATAVFGKLPVGPLTLTCELLGSKSGRVSAVNTYRARARDKVVNPTPLKRLNNYVREVFSRPLADGMSSFALAKDTWVYFGFSRPVRGASVSVDGVSDVVRYEPGERAEGMCFLRAGTHEVCVTGAVDANDVVFSVRTVKPILRCGFQLAARRNPNFNGYRYGAEFFDRLGLLRGLNVMEITSHWMNDPVVNRIERELSSRGCELEVGIGDMGAWSPKRLDLEAYWSAFTNNAAYRADRRLSFDENSIEAHAGKRIKMNAAEVWWRAYDAGRSVNVFLDDGAYGLFTNPTYDIPELSAYVNSGDGRGFLYAESYFRAVESRNELDLLVDFLRCQRRTLKETFPLAADRFSYLLCGWMMSGGWTPWYHTDVDMHAMIAEICRVLATDPEFDDNGGLTFSTPACWEEFWRFVSCALIRYYCIEGGTCDFAAMNGFKLFPGHLRNGDFQHGFEHWELEPAEPGAIALGSKPGFGSKWQGRQYPAGYRKRVEKVPGDRFAVLTRSDKAPNRIRQKIVGLEVGRLYQVICSAADLETVELGMERGQTAKAGCRQCKPVNPIVFTAEVKGAETIDDLCQSLTDFLKYGNGLNQTSRVVFRATASEAEVVFSDWRSPANPGAKSGLKTLFNYVMAHPYYVADDAQLEDLKDLHRAAKAMSKSNGKQGERLK